MHAASSTPWKLRFASSASTIVIRSGCFTSLKKCAAAKASSGRSAYEYLQQHYEVDGIADIQQSAYYVWGAAAKDYAPQSPYAVYVFKRKS
jgi:hypothetical protein